MAAPNEITPAQLNRLVGTPNCPLIVDICLDDDFATDPRLIPGSIRWAYDDPSGLSQRVRDRRVVVACQKGKKLSQGVTSWLRSEQIQAEYLQGGVLAWRDLADAPSVPQATIPSPGLWVTRHRPKIDRIACPWLIRRFVDRSARFLFVAPSEVIATAEMFNATPFDVDDVEFGHRGAQCTFDTMLDAFELRTEALDRMACVIRAADTNAADTNAHDLAPEAAGLLALSVGLSRQYKDDQAQLNAGMAIYDALYRWARDGFDEGHVE